MSNEQIAKMLKDQILDIESSKKEKGKYKQIVPHNQLELFELLNRWHINYRLSHDQFIEVTEEFNPYL